MYKIECKYNIKKAAVYLPRKYITTIRVKEENMLDKDAHTLFLLFFLDTRFRNFTFDENFFRNYIKNPSPNEVGKLVFQMLTKREQGKEKNSRKLEYKKFVGTNSVLRTGCMQYCTLHNKITVSMFVILNYFKRKK